MWQAPSRVYGAITGYDVMFADTVSTSNSSVVQNLVLKDRDQFFHVVRESDLPRPGGAPMIQVVNPTSCNGVHLYVAVTGRK